MKKVLLGAAMICLGLVLVGCSGESSSGETTQNTIVAEEPKAPDLTGDWRQVNNASEDSYQIATITDDTIEVYWFTPENETKALYWAGTYTAPETDDEPYTWDSENDTEKTDSALLASDADTKTFTYENEQISYDVTALGMTQTVRLEKTE